MEILNLKDFAQVAGIMQMAQTSETQSALQEQYTIYLDMDPEERIVFMRTLLTHIKPAVAKLHYLIQQEGI